MAAALRHQTSAPGIFAAGDVVHSPDRDSGEPLRIEHRVVPERHGQTAARNILGHRERYAAVPLSGASIRTCRSIMSVNANSWDDIEQDGDIGAHDRHCASARRDVCDGLPRSRKLGSRVSYGAAQSP